MDLTPELHDELRVSRLAPLIINMPDGNVLHDERGFDVASLLEDMSRHSGAPVSACPSPETFGGIFEESDEPTFAVTLSSQLSGSFNSARIAAEQLREHRPERKLHIFDSKSASAGETLIAWKIRELESLGHTFEEIVNAVEAFIAKMRSFFVLEDLSVFIKNGRIGRISGLVASALSIVPVMCDNGDGTITAHTKARGHAMAIRKLIDAVAEQLTERAPASAMAVISHCFCSERAEKLRTSLLERCKALRDVLIVPTGGLSSTYANRGGLIVAFG